MTNHIKIISCFSIIFLFFCMTIPASGENEANKHWGSCNEGCRRHSKYMVSHSRISHRGNTKYSFVIVPLTLMNNSAIERREVDFIITNSSNYGNLNLLMEPPALPTMNSIYEGHTTKSLARQYCEEQIGMILRAKRSHR